MFAVVQLFLKLVFWASVSLIAYTYLVYPLLMWVAARFAPSRRPVTPAESYPAVSMIIAAYNEEEVIEEKIRNCLALRYPAEKLEVLIGSDGSSDRTVELASRFSENRRVVVHAYSRRGKVWVVNDLVQVARGDVLVFSDANTIYAPEALERLVDRLRETSVGCVTGLLCLRKKGDHVGASGESFYWKYETFKKRQEQAFLAVAGANGAIYALRRELFEPLSGKTINDDFTISMRVYLKGYRIALAEDARAYEYTASDFRGEFNRHVRDSAGHYRAMLELAGMLNPLLGMPSFCYLSHRVVRWITPFLMIAALAASGLLASDAVYSWLFALQVTAYVCVAAVSPHVMRGGKIGVLFVPYYFVTINAAILIGFVKFCMGTQTSLWRPAERRGE